jgi:Asp-tRNA(Asn)/Glu-tRNA(Gln) amidotransferase A subunit family amidase
VGVLTRTVKDAAVLLTVLAGFDPNDPTSSRESAPDYARFLRPLRRPPRIGVIRAFYEKNSEKEVWETTQKAVRKFARAGARVEEVKMPPSFAAAQDAHHIIFRVEAASFHERLFETHRDLYRPNLSKLIEAGLLIPSVDYLRAQKIKGLFRKEMDEVVERYDFLVTPATSSAAPKGLSSTGNPWFQVPWSLSGLPTVGLPAGLNSQGLPLGIQLVGRAFGEGPLLAMVQWCEKVLNTPLYPKLWEWQ